MNLEAPYPPFCGWLRLGFWGLYHLNKWHGFWLFGAGFPCPTLQGVLDLGYPVKLVGALLSVIGTLDLFLLNLKHLTLS